MQKLTRRYFILGGLALAAAGGGFGWSLLYKFGAVPEKPPASPHWQNGAFHNLPDRHVNKNLALEPEADAGWLKFLFAREDGRYPSSPVPSRRMDLHSLCDGEYVWLGHSSLLIKLAGKFICMDPVLDSRASPLPFTIPAWPGSSPYEAQDFPHIDCLCISHDHWDHLDFKAVKSLKYDRILCGKGVEAHLEHWGINNFQSLDWGDEARE